MTIEQSVKNIIDCLYDSDFAAENIDILIEDIGDLNYSVGRKLRMKFVDSFENVDIEEWHNIARENGAQLSFSMNTSNGNIDLNIEFEYIKKTKPRTTWLVLIKFSISVMTAAWSYNQLNQLNPERYQMW
tara:strand:+ start:1317 stop:1706 length:390 start_codon:yes stop_codon:yes gene_type:complete